MKYTLEERKERARLLHKQGYNCSQCVVMVFDDVHGLSEEVAARASAGFGGGMGGMRHVCGAVSGMVMLEGLVKYSHPSDKPMLYAEVKAAAEEYKALNGSVVWSGLAGSVVTLNVNGKEKIHILAKKVQAKGPFVYSRDINLDFEVEHKD